MLVLEGEQVSPFRIEQALLLHASNGHAGAVTASRDERNERVDDERVFARVGVRQLELRAAFRLAHFVRNAKSE